LSSQNAKLSSDLEDTQSAKSKPGTEAVTDDGRTSSAANAAGGDATEQFEAAVQQVMATRKCRRDQAVLQVCSQQPELRQAYVQEHNDRHAAVVGARR